MAFPGVMNSHLPMIHQGPPATPLQNGRHQSEMAYISHGRSSYHPQLYHGFQTQYQHMAPSQHFQQQHPPQWYQYPPMPIPLPRPYHPYPPMMAAPYQLPHNSSPLPARSVVPQHAPSSTSTQSHQDLLSPNPSNASISTPLSRPLSVSNSRRAPSTPPPPSQRMPYYPPLPWYSFSEGSFPPKSPKRRRRKPTAQPPGLPVELPMRDNLLNTTASDFGEQKSPRSEKTSPKASVPTPNIVETPLTSHAPSEEDSTQPTTPSSAVAQSVPRLQQTADSKFRNRLSGPLLPIVPVVPNLPFISQKTKRASQSVVSEEGKPSAVAKPEDIDRTLVEVVQQSSDKVAHSPSSAATPTALPSKSTPKSWADLVRTKNQPSANGADVTSQNEMIKQSGLTALKSSSLSEALNMFTSDDIAHAGKISFLEPRGLVNTGNMCYMNSVLQILLFCIPFYNLLDHLGKQAVHNFKSETPLVDAMIMFVREFHVIDSTVSVERLRMRLKDNELEQYGEAFIPEFVYEVIRRLPRFSTMRRGHQQDAEEFLGFLLEEMHEECSKIMRSSTSSDMSGASTPTNGVSSSTSDAAPASDSKWLEVGPRQKAAITRSSGAIVIETPITKIFGGKLRSELRIPGMKNSVTLEPYQPLQLDIGSSHVNNIVDALKGLTRPETLHGDFNSPRGPGYATTKHVTIESLPPVLILHLKRFQYDNAGGTQKIWKKVGYPLELEIPKEVFPQHKRGGIIAHRGLPKYRLIGVVYHHGKNASGGHYTVDVRRQDGREWIRLDDTIIRRVRSEDVAEGGSEEDPKILAAALEQHKNDHLSGENVFEQLPAHDYQSSQLDQEWNTVNGASAAGSATSRKKWSGVLNEATTPVPTPSGKATPAGRPFPKDNKVAYLLFYQRITN